MAVPVVSGRAQQRAEPRAHSNPRSTHVLTAVMLGAMTVCGGERHHQAALVRAEVEVTGWDSNPAGAPPMPQAVMMNVACEGSLLVTSGVAWGDVHDGRVDAEATGCSAESMQDWVGAVLKVWVTWSAPLERVVPRTRLPVDAQDLVAGEKRYGPLGRLQGLRVGYANRDAGVDVTGLELEAPLEGWDADGTGPEFLVVTRCPPQQVLPQNRGFPDGGAALCSPVSPEHLVENGLQLDVFELNEPTAMLAEPEQFITVTVTQEHVDARVIPIPGSGHVRELRLHIGDVEVLEPVFECY